MEATLFSARAQWPSSVATAAAVPKTTMAHSTLAESTMMEPAVIEVVVEVMVEMAVEVMIAPAIKEEGPPYGMDIRMHYKRTEQ
jgi:hypothetical protein